jgi:hypothetical protein
LYLLPSMPGSFCNFSLRSMKNVRGDPPPRDCSKKLAYKLCWRWISVNLAMSLPSLLA